MVCIKKQPYIYFVRLTIKNRHFFRYLTCLLDRGHIKTPAGYRSNKLSKRESEILDEAIKIRDLNKSLNPNWITMDRSYIFVTNRGVPIQRNSFNESIKAANQRLEHPINKPISSHIFRHTLVSYLAEKGVPLKAIMDRVGHEDSDTTMKIYTHVTNKMKDKVVDMINELPL